jgi:hypothetical protein
MSILRLFRELRNRAKHNAAARPAELLGSWSSDSNDREANDEFGNVSLTFKPDGSLTYTIHAESTDQKMFLTWQVVDGVLITNQPSAPREERTTYSIDADGKLTLWYQGRPNGFIRADHA